VFAEQVKGNSGAYSLGLACKNISLSAQGGGLALFSFDKKEEDSKYFPKLAI